MHSLIIMSVLPSIGKDAVTLQLRVISQGLIDTVNGHKVSLFSPPRRRERRVLVFDFLCVLCGSAVNSEVSFMLARSMEWLCGLLATGVSVNLYRNSTEPAGAPRTTLYALGALGVRFVLSCSKVETYPPPDKTCVYSQMGAN